MIAVAGLVVVVIVIVIVAGLFFVGGKREHKVQVRGDLASSKVSPGRTIADLKAKAGEPQRTSGGDD